MEKLLNENKKDKYCSQCGYKRKKGEYFCPRCGYKFDDMDEEITNKNQTKKQILCD